MRLALYVHDFRLEVGHSNSLIELVRNLPEDRLAQIKEIEVVTFRASDLRSLFPNFTGKLKLTLVPFKGVGPSLLRSLYFQCWCWIYNTFFQDKNIFRIGIGICAPQMDAISIQFIHHQWTRKGLEMEKGHWLRHFYKVVLFRYYEFCENVFLNRKELRLFSPAKFLTEFLENKYKTPVCSTIYSGVNLERFLIDGRTKSEIKDFLSKKYPVLDGLDINRPVFLFVGAYERKGIDEALRILEQVPQAQFVVVGSPSLGRKTIWPEKMSVFPIEFSREISMFYSLCDAFIFPTLYEPFGLVLFEAMAMGLTVITREKEVGASELLKGLPEVYFTDRADFKVPTIKVKGQLERERLRDQRLQMLGDISWKKSAQQLEQFLFRRGP